MFGELLDRGSSGVASENRLFSADFQMPENGWGVRGLALNYLAGVRPRKERAPPHRRHM